MKKISNILKCTKAKLLSGIGGKTSKMVMLPEIESFHSDITLRQFYKSEYPERYKAVGKGTCTIYVYAKNGNAKRVKVTVR